MYKTILFDLDGTLTDPKAGITKSVQYALKKFDIDEDVENLVRFIGPPLILSFQKYYSFDEEKAWKAVEYYREYFGVTGMYENTVYERIPEFLKELKKRNIKNLVVSSKAKHYVDKIIDHFNLREYFIETLGPELNDKKILKKDLIKNALSLIDHDHKHVVMVGDRAEDIVGANANNIDSIAVLYGYGSRKELEQENPTHIVNSIKKLEELLT